MTDSGSIDAFIMDTGSIDGFWIAREWIKKTTKAALGPNAAGAAFVVVLIHWTHESIIHYVSLSIILSRLL